ncbi:MAG: hypothetical protein IT350_17240 [Deltaproteobacteria bacterium]|nr:hypothetical protein [Deltaproteobacteria bacterium]
MKHSSRFARFVVLFLLTTVVAATAATAGTGPQEVTVVGQNICLGCTLKSTAGAGAQCSIYGHRHVLKVESAKGSDGKPIADLAGLSLHYLENEGSASLFKGEETHGKKVEIKGKLYRAESTIEVTEFQVQ